MEGKTEGDPGRRSKSGLIRWLTNRHLRVWGWGLVGVMMMIAAGAAWGQVEVEWERIYGGEEDDDWPTVVQTRDGGFAMAGSTRSFGAGSIDYWLLKLDHNGDSLWSATYGSDSLDDYCTNLVELEEGYLALVGGSYSPEDFMQSSIFVVVTDSLGEVRWPLHYEGIAISTNAVIRRGDFGLDIVHTSIGVSNTYATLLRLGADGEIQQCITIAPSMLQPSIISFGDELVIASHPGSSTTLTRLGAEGNPIVERSFINKLFYEMTSSSDGGVVTGSPPFKVNYDLDDVWSSDFQDRYVRAILETADGNFVFAGPGYRNAEGDREENQWLTNVSPNGDSLWSVKLLEGGDNVRSMIRLEDGSYLIASETGRGGGGSNWRLVRTTPDPVSIRDPFPLPPCALLLEQAFPNPFNSSTTISFTTGPINREATRLQIFDPLGRRIEEVLPVKMLNAGRHSVVWNATGVPAGEYIVRLEAGGEARVASLQVVK